MTSLNQREQAADISIATRAAEAIVQKFKEQDERITRLESEIRQLKEELLKRNIQNLQKTSSR